MTKEDFTVVRNDGWDSFPVEGINKVFRWGCTATINCNENIKVINSARAIHRVTDKRGFRDHLQEKAYDIVPRTWVDFACIEITYPCIIRPATHSRGRELYVCNNIEDSIDVVRNHIHGDYYISELIDKSAEYRVFMVQGKVISVARKTPGNPEDVAWNVARGGRFDNVRWNNWPIDVLEVARIAFEESKLHFGGVDVMVDQNNRAYVIEINSAPSLTSPYRQECMAKAFDYMVNNDSLLLPLYDSRRGYGRFIHPCIDTS